MENISTLSFIKAAGGLGIFLLGMIVMTDGLRSLAGDTIRNALMRFTKTPYSGALTGAIGTALLQSSSATTVAAVGFVGAGLMAFPEALGIIFGANIGTTVTGWLVAILGFKLDLSTVVLPFILLGMIAKLFFKGKISGFGYALAGFGLIFVGIVFLQNGMQGFEGMIDTNDFPPDSWGGRIKLVLMGMIVTIITQSSSAGVAATLTALYVHTITFEQAAVLIIGMDIGTTFTAVMASIGGTVNVRRTGFSHVVYNIFTGIMALFLVTPYTEFVQSLSETFIDTQAQIALVAFYSFFNLLGVLIILPFTKQFANLMMKLIPSNELYFTAKLDERLLKDPSLALEVARVSAQKEYIALLEHINFLLGDNKYGKEADLTLLQSSLDETQEYIDKIELQPKEISKWERMISLVHILDHLQRLHERCEEEAYRAKMVELSSDLHKERQLLTTTNQKIIDAFASKKFDFAIQYAQETEKTINNSMQDYRENIAHKIAKSEITIPEGTKQLEAVRWLSRVSTHIWRIVYYTEKMIIYTAK
ncbi:MAG: Na/Pi cotransporter family protein [Campylobacterales bacterium]|nr:Na/Pi cotransporter family protein [Campylobacterales bacterium]